MTLNLPDPQLTLEEALRLHGASKECKSHDIVLESARDKVIEAARKVWEAHPEDAARVEEGLRLFERLRHEND